MTRSTIKLALAGLALATVGVTAVNATPSYNEVKIKFESQATQPVWVTTYDGKKENLDHFCLQAGASATRTLPDFTIAETGSVVYTRFE